MLIFHVLVLFLLQIAKRRNVYGIVPTPASHTKCGTHQALVCNGLSPSCSGFVRIGSEPE